MKTTWKFELKLTDKQSISIPKGAEILTIKMQEDNICLWALVDTENKNEDRFIEIFGTGTEIHCDMGVDRKYISTFQMHGGKVIFHVFERIN